MNEYVEEADRIFNKIKYMVDHDDTVSLDARPIIARSLQKKQDEIERLTARNKELESKLVGLIDQNGKVMIENHDLKSRLATAREAMSECLNSGRIEYWWAETLQKSLAELGEK